jgi:rhamnose transport system ATP-binding protein
MTEQASILTTHNIHMAFAGVDVLKGVSISLYPGEVHGLVGENGAGKSTLAKIIAGVHQPTVGEIKYQGHTVRIPGPHAAADFGIALIHQEPLTFPDLDVAENIFAGRQPLRGQSVNWGAMYKRAQELLTSLGVQIDPRTKVRGMSIADQQMIEMAAALSQDVKVVLMDEPTASLTPSEVAHLLTNMRRLRDQGVAIVFISHRLEEVFEICDRVSVLRDGELIGERDVKTTTVDEIIRLMVGRPLSALFEKPSGTNYGQPLLEVKGLSRTRKFADITLDVRAGEVVGLAGLVGAGRTDVGRALFGLLDTDSGEVRLDGKPFNVRTPREAMAHGLVYVPEDRQHHGLLMPMTISQNMTLSILERLSPRGWLRDQTERAVSHDYIQKLHIVLRHVGQAVRELSGGNQQKVVLSKWLLTRPKVLILDEPTRGIDIGAKAEIHRLMGELVAQGMAILMISSELPEVLAMSDRIVVMREGCIVARLDKTDATQERIIAAATGQVIEEVNATIRTGKDYS